MAAPLPEPFVRCRRCGTRILGEAVNRSERATGKAVSFHAGCWAMIVQSSAEMKDRRTEVRHFATRRLEHLRSEVPAWYRVGSPEFLRTVRSDRLRKFAEVYEPRHRSVLILGQSGTGKTTACAAMVHRLADEAIEAAVEAARFDAPALVLGARIVWTRAIDLVSAVRSHPLGQGQTPLVERAREASILVIDDLGQEVVDTVMTDVLDHRYAHGSPTIATSGLTSAEFRLRYGEALHRRLTEVGIGREIDMHDSGVTK